MVRLWIMASCMRVTALILLALTGWTAIRAQTSAGQSAPVPEWQTGAGGKMEFDVASIRLSQPGTFTPPSFPLGPDDSYRKVGGNFASDWPVWVLVQFAYKLDPDEAKLMRDSLPKWANDEAYTVHARSENADATKNQMRLMVQALLADRFKLAMHFESRDVPVFALGLIKPGQTGPKLRPHSEGPSCDVTLEATPENVQKVFPLGCDSYTAMQGSGKMVRWGSRNTTMELLASSLGSFGRLGRPVVNRTALTGRFDFVMEFQPAEQPGASEPSSSEDATGLTFLEAVKNQLGLKLEATKAPVRVLVVDHLERPSEN